MTRLLQLLLAIALSASPAAGQVTRGVSLNGLGVAGTQTPRMEAIDYYKAKGLGAFRVPVAWELIQPTLAGPLDPTTVARIRAVLDRAGPDAPVVIEIHNSGRYRGEVVGRTSAVNLVHFMILWDQLARTFPARNIQYGLMNEPHDLADAEVVAMMNTGLAAIRRAETIIRSGSHLVLVSANGWSNRASMRRGASNWTLLSQIVDSGGNWAIDYHVYLDPWSAGQSAAIEPGWKTQVQEAIAEARARRKRLVIGEWAVAGDAVSLAAGREARALFEASPDVVLGWYWWAGGGWWPHDYLYLLDPYGSMWDVTNPARDWRLGGSSKASTWAGPLVDRPQMAILAP